LLKFPGGYSSGKCNEAALLTSVPFRQLVFPIKKYVF